MFHVTFVHHKISCTLCIQFQYICVICIWLLFYWVIIPSCRWVEVDLLSTCTMYSGNGKLSGLCFCSKWQLLVHNIYTNKLTKEISPLFPHTGVHSTSVSWYTCAAMKLPYMVTCLYQYACLGWCAVDSVKVSIVLAGGITWL